MEGVLKDSLEGTSKDVLTWNWWYGRIDVALKMYLRVQFKEQSTRHNKLTKNMHLP